MLQTRLSGALGSEETGGGVGRSRPWQVVHLGWITDSVTGKPEHDIAAESLVQFTLRRKLDRHQQWRRNRLAYPPQWQQVGGAPDTVWWVTPDEAQELEAKAEELLYLFRDRLTDPSRRPSGAAPVEFIALTHLMDPPVAGVPTENVGEQHACPIQRGERS